ncbi:hypothetical protein F383_00849 [Gossypium arboreum]|uniref:Uncharacterized protein n=1 Tax=Gossypium arboreum TaxID=29729 RepID=A0A0B0PJQ7_GOSAR|nr:hypothetical protein F383_00849 [Gossypium arboreum]
MWLGRMRDSKSSLILQFRKSEVPKI